ncbi:MAG: prepilin-type N-terminal cleavage/methylation domain-containing protein [Verrucomicrobia bacterium]|nr:prepilin-type N-terminal cleavage/methylation domain-containing protein [Verrucomicrobiota bacterium]
MKPLPPSPRGFSLVELSCSMGVGSIVLLLAASMLGSSGDGYQKISSNIANAREARAIISQLDSDLATAKFHPSQIIETPPSERPSHRLGFLSLQAPQAQSEQGRIGDLCAVNYYLADLQFGGQTVRCLMRGMRESADTYAALKTQSTGSLFEKQSVSDEPIGFGVVSFEVQAKTKDAKGEWIDWSSNATSTSTAPEALALRLVIASQSLCAKLKSSDDWNGTGANSKFLGKLEDAATHSNLEIHKMLIRFGNHESP